MHRKCRFTDELAVWASNVESSWKQKLPGGIHNKQKHTQMNHRGKMWVCFNTKILLPEMNYFNTVKK